MKTQQNNIFQFSAGLTYGIKSNEACATFSANEVHSERGIRWYFLNENAANALYETGMRLDYLYRLADVADSIVQLNAGEELYIIWSDRVVAIADTVQELNERVVANLVGHPLSNYFNNCCYRIRRTPKQYKIFHLKPIELRWFDDDAKTEENHWYKGAGWYNSYNELRVSWEQAKREWLQWSGR